MLLAHSVARYAASAEPEKKKQGGAPTGAQLAPSLKMGVEKWLLTIY